MLPLFSKMFLILKIMEAEITPKKVRINMTGKDPSGRCLNFLLLGDCKSLLPCLSSWIGINKVHSSEERDFTFLEAWWRIKRSQVAINCQQFALLGIWPASALFFFPNVYCRKKKKHNATLLYLGKILVLLHYKSIVWCIVFVGGAYLNMHCWLWMFRILVLTLREY